MDGNNKRIDDFINIGLLKKWYLLWKLILTLYLNLFMNRTCSPGEYEIFVSVGLMDGTPVFELPYNDSDSHKTYKLGKVIIK